jgi:2-hydroxymuconate-semialdehyde hydrolase
VAAEITTTTVAVGDYQFNLNEAGTPGSSTPVLFLHGSGPGATALSNWERVLGDLGQDRYCFAPDVTGFGDSTHPEIPPPSNREFTELRIDLLIGLLDTLKLDKVDLVGNSMGGMWSLGIADKAPGRVNRLVLMGSGGSPVPMGPTIPALAGFYQDPTTDAMEKLLEAFVYDPGLFGGELRQIAENRMPQAQRADVERSHRATFETGDWWSLPAERIAAIQQETLVLHGREDQFVPFGAGIWFFQNIPNARFYGIGHCGHWFQIEEHDRFVSAVQAFLDGRL